MSPFWSGWIMFLVVLNMGITLFLFVWGTRVEIPTQPDGTSGHVWAHGVLREGVRKLPLWWVLMSASMFIAGFTYLALYPGFGSYKGILGWTAHGELARDTAANRTKLDPLLARFNQGTVAQLAADADATRIGHRLFIDNCAACHGRQAGGNPGFPNLADGDWLYGDGEQAIMASILDGRQGTMPALGSALGLAGTDEVANYVLSLSGADHNRTLARAGAPRFAQVCAACHGADGRGNQALGAPNLADATWLYGGDLDTIRETILRGRSGQMPAWRSRLNEDQARLIAAWVMVNGQSAPAAGSH